MTIPTLKITGVERERLVDAATAALSHERPPPAASMLLGELRRATIVESDCLPPHVVTLHRGIVVRDNITDTKKRLYLVYPGEEDTGPDAISVLSPLGGCVDRPVGR